MGVRIPLLVTLGIAVTFAAIVPIFPAMAQSVINPSHQDMPDPSQGKQGITHKALLRTDLAGSDGQEVIVWDTEYAPRAINPRHYHPAAITFRVVSGTGVW